MYNNITFQNVRCKRKHFSCNYATDIIDQKFISLESLLGNPLFCNILLSECYKVKPKHFTRDICTSLQAM